MHQPISLLCRNGSRSSNFAGSVRASNSTLSRSASQNGFIEAFKGRLGDECLNEDLFTSLPAARRIIEAWRIDYNTRRQSARQELMSTVTSQNWKA